VHSQTHPCTNFGNLHHNVTNGYKKGARFFNKYNDNLKMEFKFLSGFKLKPINLKVFFTKKVGRREDNHTSHHKNSTVPSSPILFSDFPTCRRAIYQSSVGDPDTNVTGSRGSGSITQRYGSGSGSRSFPFLIKM
jgi:hypothetical protein